MSDMIASRIVVVMRRAAELCTICNFPSNCSMAKVWQWCVGGGRIHTLLHISHNYIGHSCDDLSDRADSVAKSRQMLYSSVISCAILNCWTIISSQQFVAACNNMYLIFNRLPMRRRLIAYNMFASDSVNYCSEFTTIQTLFNTSFKNIVVGGGNSRPSTVNRMFCEFNYYIMYRFYFRYYILLCMSLLVTVFFMDLELARSVWNVIVGGLGPIIFDKYVLNQIRRIVDA